MKTERYIPESSMNKEELNLKKIFDAFKHYRKSILIIVLIATLLAFAKAYFSTTIYQSETLIKLAENQKSANSDFIEMTKYSNIEDEMVAFRTKRLAERALQNLNLGTRYYTKRNLKSYELYKDSPFIVTFEYLSPRAMGVPIQLLPSSKENHFRLIMGPTLKQKVINTVRSFIAPLPADKQPIVYDKLHSFGEKIETPWFTIAVQEIHELENNEYYFTMIPNESMTDFIGKNLTVSSSSEEGSIIILDFEDSVPLRAKEILDVLSNAYINENIDNKSRSAERKLHFIDMQLKAIDKMMIGSAKNIERFKATNIMVDLSSKALLTAEKLSDLETQLYEINMNIDVKEGILNYIETHKNIKDIKGINITSALQSGQNEATSSIILEIQKAIIQRNDLLSSFTEAHPRVIRINRQFVSLRNSLKVAIQGSLRTLQKRKQTLSNIIKDNTAKMQALPGQEQRLARLTRNFMVNEKIYSYLLEKRAETAISESSTVSEISIFEFPTVADLPIKPNRLNTIVIGFLLGLIFGMMQALLRANLDNTIKSVEDIETLSSIPIYGSIPFLNSKKESQSYYEALRVIRTNIDFLQNTGKSKIITITSSVPGEGKSSTITELGKIIAKSNKKVIILDIDMRRPSVYKKFDFSNNIGMSTLLAGRNSLEEVIQKTKDINLNTITSGPIPPNPSELIMSDKLKDVLKHLILTYDYVLIDSPPIGMVTDAMITMYMSDLNLIVLRANYSKKEFIGKINRLVDEHDLNAGLILNGQELKDKAGYGYGYGYDYATKDGNNYYGTEK